MNQNEQTRLKVLNSVMVGQLPVAQAAELLGVSERHVWRVLAACGSSSLGDLVTIVLVQERLSNGELVPVANANIDYRITVGMSTSARIRFSDRSDANGLSAVRQETGGENPAEFRLMVADVTHPDGRTAQARRRRGARSKQALTFAAGSSSSSRCRWTLRIWQI